MDLLMVFALRKMLCSRWIGVIVVTFVMSLCLGCDDVPDTPDEQAGDRASGDSDQSESSEEDDNSADANGLEAVSLAAEERAEVDEVFRRNPDTTRRNFGDFRGAQIAYALSLDEIEDIRILRIGEAKISAKEAELIAASPRLAQVRKMPIYRTEFEPEALQILLESEHLTNLESLRLSSLVNAKSVIPAMADIELPSGLEELALSNMKLGNEIVVDLVHSELFAGPETLSLTGNELGDAAVLALSQDQGLAELKRLALAHNQITDLGALALAESEHLTNLNELTLDENAISDRGVTYLAQSEGLNLEELSIRDNSIGPQGIQALEEMDATVLRFNELREAAYEEKFSAFTEESARQGHQVSDLAQLAAEKARTDPKEMPTLTPPAPDGTSTCPDDLTFRVVRFDQDVPLFYHRLLRRPIPGSDWTSGLLIPTDEEARELDLQTDAEPVWVFTEEEGRPCPMLPRTTAIYPDGSYGHYHTVVSALEGECDVENTTPMWDLMGQGHYVLAAQTEEMPADCRIEISGMPLRGGDREDLAKLKADLGADPPMSCDDDEECSYDWRYQRQEFADGTAMVAANEALSRTPPADAIDPCGPEITDSWASGLLFEKDGAYHELGSTTWTKIFRLVNADGEPSMMFFADQQGRFTALNFDEQGLPVESYQWAWFVELEDDLGVEPSFSAAHGLDCVQP